MSACARLKDGRQPMLKLTAIGSMLYAGELFAVSYILVSAICLVYQLQNQSLVTVECRGFSVFCLEDNEQARSIRYVLSGEDIEHRCNSQGSSGVFHLFVLTLVALEVLLFLGVVYKYRLKTIRLVAEDNSLLRLTYALVTITGLLIGLLILLPLVYYTALSTTTDFTQGDGFFNNLLYSPPRAILSLIITLATTPFKSIVNSQFAIDLHLDDVYANFTCVDPVRDRATDVYQCALARAWPAGMPEPSSCKRTFHCADNECLVIFPRIIISSLSVILASFVLCYRLLKLRHDAIHVVRTARGNHVVAEREERVVYTVALNESGIDNTTAKTGSSTAVDRCKMKEKSVVGCSSRSMEAAVLGFEEQSAYDRELVGNSNLEGNQSSGNERCGNERCGKQCTNGGDINGHDGLSNHNTHRQFDKVRRFSNRNGDFRTRRRNDNGLLRRGPARMHLQNGALEEFDVYSSSEELGEVTLVEDESEHYMSGFRL